VNENIAATDDADRPAGLIDEGAPLISRRVSRSMASRTVALSRIETGLGVIKSAAVVSGRIRRGTSSTTGALLMGVTPNRDAATIRG